MQATVTVFLSETHIQTFGKGGKRIMLDHPKGLSYDSALQSVSNTVRQMGGYVESLYFEKNEFDDPITCYFVEF